MSGLQEDKHHIKISSVEFIKIPSAHPKNYKDSWRSRIALKGIVKKKKFKIQ